MKTSILIGLTAVALFTFAYMMSQPSTKLQTAGELQPLLHDIAYKWATFSPKISNLVFEVRDASDKNNAKIQLNNTYNHPWQLFQVFPEDDIYSKIQIQHDLKVIIVDGAHGENIVQYTEKKDDKSNQIFRVIPQNDGTYSILSDKHNCYLRAQDGGERTISSEIICHKEFGEYSKFSIVPVIV